ncbi:MAG: hypothetical protein JXQ76_00170 [Campylobacterales bacterium]|nr:hypothetical protein [Campylobacterales bacterium]
MKKIMLSFVSVCAMSSVAFAGGDIVEPVVAPVVEEVPVMSPSVAVGLKVGTLGLGLDISKSITEKLNLRFNINGASYSTTETEEGIEYDFDLELVTAGLLLDYYPMAGEFRVSAGAYYNGNEFTLDANAAGGVYTIGGNTYDARGVTLKGLLDFDELAPYVGIGWGNSTKKAGWGFSVDLGVMYHGEPNVDLTSTCDPTQVAGGTGTCATIDADVNAEERDLLNDLSDYKFYPVVSVGVTYTF